MLQFRGLVACSLLVAGYISTCHAVLPRDASEELVLQFPHGSFTLSKRQRDQVIELLERVRRDEWCPLQAVLVFGHADPQEGDAKKTQLLSERRADSVKSILTKYGLPNRIISSEAI